MKPRIISISSESIIRSLEATTRQYLVGDLERPQKLRYIKDTKVEIGITSYESYAIEKPHTHSQAYEYQYVVSGFTEYLDLDNNEQISFRKGDFYRIEPGVKYAQKSKPGTTILFIKVPPGNDKIAMEPSEAVSAWLAGGINSKRVDYTDRDDAPVANTIRPAVAVALFGAKNEMLMLKRQDSGNWTLPGGTLEFGESLVDCARREVKEETGFNVEISDIIGTYTCPKTVVAYLDGEVRQEFTIVYTGRILSGKIELDEESTEFKWAQPDDVLSLPLADSQRRRIRDIIEYMRSGERFLR